MGSFKGKIKGEKKMRITVKMIEDQVSMLNDYLSEDCINNISVKFEKPTKQNFSTITILKNNEILINDKLNYSDVHKAVSTKTELFFCLGRVIKFLNARDAARTQEIGEKRYHYISDDEIVKIFDAAFWR